MSTRRALHFVFKVGNRTETAKFYRDVLGMKFLRHEEFEKGCEAACNGPYDGKWSKSMVGYGPEDNHFVVELTYNYGIGTYRLGTDFRGINISSKEAFKNLSNCGYAVSVDGGRQEVKSPDGYSFTVEDTDSQGDPVQSVCLGCSDLSKSVDFWTQLCGMKVYKQENKLALLGFDDTQCKLELQDIGTSVDHATAYGRIAFSCPRTELPDIEKKMKDAGQTILTPLISLDTPGKATVEVVIVADPDGHEICFVGDEAFRELSQVDDKADELLDQGIAADKSDEWFKKKGLTKGTA
ncbi:glyoxalase domain-containing protein 4-like [Argopecten irradians]|uniref:glyoxalase domain-containing protein 4-like n=1 Tax=Argopecten irradians TaxID=31199 RepID=UPI00371654F2